MSKNFVLDTNVLINNPKCVLESFEDNDIILPFVVIEELDNLKTREGIGYAARESLRNIEKIRGDSKDIRNGVVRNDKGGLLRIVTVRDVLKELNTEGLDETVPDNLIVLTALKVMKEDDSKETVFISNDANARIKASFMDLKAERYLEDVVGEEYLSYTGMRTIELPLSFFGEMKETTFYPRDISVVPVMDLDEELPNLIENEFVLVTMRQDDLDSIETLSKKEKKHLKKVFRKKGDILEERRFDHTLQAGIRGKNLEQSAAIDVLEDNDVKVVTLSGPAGTGKTICAVSSALKQVLAGKFDRIILLKSTVSASEDIGFLPGSVDDKMGPIFANYRDTVDMLKKLETVDKNSTNENDFDSLVKNGVIQLEHIGFLRGRSINDSIIIWDEAQNCKKTLSKTIVSRVGMNSRIFILGDPEQIDDSHLSREDNSLSHIVKNLRNESIYAHITLDKCERSAVSKLAGRVL